jgi:dihydrofolate synthase/folylpolyglutamate synthase
VIPLGPVTSGPRGSASTRAGATPIDLDHTEFLGDTPEQIAHEKSGIIKRGATVALARQSARVESVVLRHAAEADATVVLEGVDFSVISREVAGDGQRLTLRGLGGDRREIFLPLHGAHMAQNAAVALAAVEAFAGSSRTLDDETIRQAFGSVTSPGRLELISTNPTVILDGAHNPAGARATAGAVLEAYGKVVGVVSPSADKDVRGLLENFEPAFEQVVVTRNSSPRVMDVARLATIAVEIFGANRVLVEPRLEGALDEAIHVAGSGAVLVTGSLLTAGEARRLYGGASGSHAVQPG